MSQDWKTTRVSDICKTNPNTYSVSEKWSYVNYLDTGSITENSVSEIQHLVIGRDTLPSRARRKVVVDDILYSTVRPNQRHYGIVKDVVPNMLVSTGFAVIRVDKAKADADYLYYYLTQNAIVDGLHAIGEQSVSAYPSIKPSDIESLEMLLPSLPEQVEIGRSLKALDDKIANNTKINHHLEQISLAIFKTWFVDFEPFANDGFVESELGEIPTGWSVVTLDDVCFKITDGSHFSPKDSSDGTYPMLSVRDMDSYGFNYTSCKMINDNDYVVMVANDCVPLVNDILVAKDGSYLKHIFIVNEQRKEAILSSIAIFRPNPKVICPELLLCFLKTPATQQTIKDNFVSGSALPRIVLKDFKKLKLVLPPIEVQLRVFDLLSGIRKQIAANQAENANLVAIRDSLLPRLMSGELSVSDIDDK